MDLLWHLIDNRRFLSIRNKRGCFLYKQGVPIRHALLFSRLSKTYSARQTCDARSDGQKILFSHSLLRYSVIRPVPSSKLHYIHHCPLHIQRCFGTQHQGQRHATVTAHTGVQHTDIVQGLLRAPRGKAERQRLCEGTAGRLSEEDLPLGWRWGADVQCVLDRVGFPRAELNLSRGACVPADIFSGAAPQPPGQTAVRAPQYSLPLAS